MIVVWLFLRVYLQFVIMVFPDHTHLLFLYGLPIVEASRLFTKYTHFFTVVTKQNKYFIQDGI